MSLICSAVTTLQENESYPSEDWEQKASILETLSQLPSHLTIPSEPTFNAISDSFIRERPLLHGKVLVQLVEAFVYGPHPREDAVRVLLQSISGREVEIGARCMADVAQALSMDAAKWASDIKTMVGWLSSSPEARATDEVSTRSLSAKDTPLLPLHALAMPLTLWNILKLPLRSLKEPGAVFRKRSMVRPIRLSAAGWLTHARCWSARGCVDEEAVV
jgi:hypothetical protein